VDLGLCVKSIPYSKGLVHGMVTTYYESCRVFKEVKYEYDKPKLMKVFNEDGTLADIKEFLDKKVIEMFKQ
jgi:antitoxin component YwqK of YwqJK toxin-antitoxin module